jgi:hypothetical protein
MESATSRHQTRHDCQREPHQPERRDESVACCWKFLSSLNHKETRIGYIWQNLSRTCTTPEFRRVGNAARPRLGNSDTTGCAAAPTVGALEIFLFVAQRLFLPAS